ncbi:MAG: fuculose phosphate aldolase [Tissierellia bacterium]|nr:fuculose phosphate aldolase [Tissierellia bacterium]
MKLTDFKKQIIIYGNNMIKEGLTTASGGNISVRVPGDNSMYITPSGMDYSTLTADNIVKTSFDGNYDLEGNKPSSEWSMHSILYENRENCNAVVHTHSPYLTTLACLGKALPAIHYLVASSGLEEVPIAPYRPFGTIELAEAAHNFMGEGKAVILEHHGLICYSDSLGKAMDIARELEFCAKVYINALQVKEDVPILSHEEMLDVLARFQNYGQGR